MDDQNWRSGSGEYVRPRKQDEPDPWANEMAQQGKTGSQKLLMAVEVTPPDDIRDALGLGPDEQVILRRRLVLADHIPVELTDSYYPASVARGTALAELRKIRGGAVAALAALGHVPRFVSETVHARMASTDELAMLELRAEQAVLVLFRITKDEERQPIEATMMVIADGRHLHYQLAT